MSLPPARHRRTGAHNLLPLVQTHLGVLHIKEALAGTPLPPVKRVLLKVVDRLGQGPGEEKVSVAVLDHLVAGDDKVLEVAVPEEVDGLLDGPAGGDVGVDADLAACPDGHAAAWLEDVGGRLPEQGHVEPVGGVGGGDEVDAVFGCDFLKLLGRADLEVDRLGCFGEDGVGGEEVFGGCDHAFAGVDADGMRKMGSEGTDGVGAGAAAYVEEGVELAAGVGVVVEDGFVEGRVVVWPVFGVVFAVFLAVGPEGLFSFLVRHGGLVVMMERGCCKRRNCLKDSIGNRHD